MAFAPEGGFYTRGRESLHTITQTALADGSARAVCVFYVMLNSVAATCARVMGSVGWIPPSA